MHCFNLRLLGLGTMARERQCAAHEFRAVGSAFTICTISISPALPDQLVLDLKVDGGGYSCCSEARMFRPLTEQWNVVLVYGQGKFFNNWSS